MPNKRIRKKHPHINVQHLYAQIKLLKDQVSSLKQDLLPVLREREAIEEGKTKMIVSCDASCTKDGQATTGVVIRSSVLNSNVPKDVYTISKPTKSGTSNEAELDAIYTGLEIVTSMFLKQVGDKRVTCVEVRSDSQLCIDWLTGKKKSKIPRIINKIQMIKDSAKAVGVFHQKSVRFIWRRRNSTTDLNIANELAQRLNNVSVH